MPTDDIGDVWKRSDVVRAFLDERSLLLPHREEQVDVMLRVLRAAPASPPRRALDLGCGSGILLAALLAAFPGCAGVGVDYSPPMLASARERLAPYAVRVRLVEADLSHPLPPGADGPFDAIVSGFAIHHLPDERKQPLYREIFERLSPGGAFVHAEHVASVTPHVEELFNDAMVEHLYRRRRERGEEVSLDQVRQHFLDRPDRAANLLAPLETQLAWLREIGFTDVDCYWKWFELAIFGGYRR